MNRQAPKPRTLRELLDDCRERAYRGRVRPLPVPPSDAPKPPPSHHDREESKP